MIGEAGSEARGRVEGEARGEANGRIEGERRIQLRVGTKRFGEPGETTLVTIRAISSQEQLDQLSDRLLEVESWEELIG